MAYSKENIEKAKKLRKEGYSFGEISKKLNIAKSTAYLWENKVKLSKKAIEILMHKRIISREKASKILSEKRELIKKGIMDKANKTIKRLTFTPEINKLLCSMLYWAEGAKSNKSLVTFINSDPNMISTFLKLFRSVFALDERKFRCLVHIHEYHNNDEIKKYWSNITKIPIGQFSKSYLKPHSKIRIRDDYKGTISIRYYDYKIALELSFIYNMFAGMLGSK